MKVETKIICKSKYSEVALRKTLYIWNTQSVKEKAAWVMKTTTTKKIKLEKSFRK